MNPGSKSGGAAKIALVIPVFNGREAFARCLAGVRALSPPPDELVIVNDGSNDWDPNLLDPGMRLCTLPRRSGPAAARNHGARATSAPLILFLDADVIPQPDLIGRVREIFAGDPALAAAFGSYDDAPAAPGFFAQYKNLIHHFTHQRASPEAFTFWCACGAIRRETLLQLGGFNERYTRPCIEDIELGYRVREAGLRIGLRREVQVKHLKSWTARTQLETDFFDRALPWTELLLRKGRIDADLNLKYLTRFKVALAGLMLLLLIASAWSPAARKAALVLFVLQLALDLPLFRFFRSLRGSGFALRAALWHQHHYWLCGSGFIAGLARHFFTARAQPEPSTAPTAPR